MIVSKVHGEIVYINDHRLPFVALRRSRHVGGSTSLPIARGPHPTGNDYQERLGVELGTCRQRVRVCTCAELIISRARELSRTGTYHRLEHARAIET